MSGTVRARVAGLLDRALARYAGTPAEGALRSARQRMDAPLRVAIAGKMKAGKSTLLNALVGQALAPTDAGECTRIVTWYRDGLTYRVTLHPVDGVAVQVPFRRHDDALEIRLEGRTPADVDRLVVEWPSASLRAMTLIDTPGIASLSTDISQRTHAFLAPENRPGEADAVCYLMRHLHATDARFLEAFHDDDAAHATPMNAVGVLSRADEIGVGRLHALETAGRIARRYRTDPQVRRLCQTVVPVAGLLAQAGVTLREDEYGALTALVRADHAVVSELLLSADRFCGAEADVGVGSDVRRALLERLGLFGVRVGLALIRSGQAKSAPDLAAALVRRSGVEALREVLATQFAARADLLKARSGLAVLSSVLRAHPGPGVEDLAGEAERILIGTHAFAEARLLNALRAGAVPLDDASVREAERLLGGHGDTPGERLGLAAAGDGPSGLDGADEPDGAELRTAAVAAVARWRRRAEHPMAAPQTVEVAMVVVRSCEGILHALTDH
jgi:hypothetical protein